MLGMHHEVPDLTSFRLQASSLKRVLVATAAGALLQASVVPALHGTCVRFAADELPRLGFIRGAWLDDTRFVLADFKRSRLLVYSTEGGFDRTVLGLGTSTTSSFSEPIDVERWGEGVLVADSTFDRQSLVALDRDLKTSTVLTSSDSSEHSETARHETHWRAGTLQELSVLGDSVYLRGSFGPEGVVVEMAKDRTTGSSPPHVVLREEWPLSLEEAVLHQVPIRKLAVTGGPTAAAFMLRYGDDGGFIQRLGPGPTTRRLSAFAGTKTLPALPANHGRGSHEAYYALVEASSYFAGLYAEADSLYILAKTVTDDGLLWNLHQIDPDRDSVVGSVRLPTTAVHVSLLPGPVHWVLEESSSISVDSLRKPTRLLLLDSEAIRSSQPITCD